jgi:hypothetical protein
MWSMVVACLAATIGWIVGRWLVAAMAMFSVAWASPAAQV